MVANDDRSKCGNEPLLNLFKPTEHIPEIFCGCDSDGETGMKDVDDGASNRCALIIRGVTCD